MSFVRKEEDCAYQQRRNVPPRWISVPCPGDRHCLAYSTIQQLRHHLPSSLFRLLCVLGREFCPLQYSYPQQSERNRMYFDFNFSAEDDLLQNKEQNYSTVQKLMKLCFFARFWRIFSAIMKRILFDLNSTEYSEPESRFCSYCLADS